MWTDSIPGAAGESAGGGDDRFTARIHGLIDLQREIGDQAAEWAERRDPRAEDYTALLAVESMRSLLLLKAAELTERDEPPSIDEVAHLALALHRIDATNRHRLAREQAAAETAAPPAPREPPSTEEMRALLGPAIKEAFTPNDWARSPGSTGRMSPRLPSPILASRSRRGTRAPGIPLRPRPWRRARKRRGRRGTGPILRGRAKRRTGTARLSGTNRTTYRISRAPIALVLERRIVAAGNSPRPLAMVRPA